MAHELHLPALGEKFPITQVDTTGGNITLPNEYEGKWFVLFSHPGDFTPVCTSEFESFAMSDSSFRELNCELIGLSMDTIESHDLWIKWIKENAPVPVKFPIIGGPSAVELANKLGMVHPKLGNASIRAVFIVDPKGILRLMMYYPMEIGRNIHEIIRSVQALQTFDKSNGFTPADYPHNAWVGEDTVLLKRPNDPEKIINFDKMIDSGEIKSKAKWFNYKKR